MGLVKRPAAEPSAPAPLPTIPALDAADPALRRAAIRALADDPFSEVALCARLPDEPDAAVRDLLLTTLSARPSRALVRRLLPHLQSGDCALRNAVAETLEVMPDALDAEIEPMLRHADPDVRILALVTLGHAATPRAASLAEELLAREEHVNVCAAALESLALVGGAASLPAVEAVARRLAGQPFIAFAAALCARRLRGAP